MGQDKEATRLKISEPLTSMKQQIFLSRWEDKVTTRLKISEPVTSMKQQIFLSNGAGQGGLKTKNITACHIYETTNEMWTLEATGMWPLLLLFCSMP